MDSALERQISSASRSVEEARRLAYHDPVTALASARRADQRSRRSPPEGRRLPQGRVPLPRGALSRARKLRKTDPDLLTGIYSLLAHLYDRWGRMDKAAEFYEKALHISEDNGSDSEKVATIKNNLAMIFKQPA
jgi:tetratricopeptide (TPR) repeat protein